MDELIDRIKHKKYAAKRLYAKYDSSAQNIIKIYNLRKKNTPIMKV